MACATCGGALSGQQKYCSRLCSNGRLAGAVPRTSRSCEICGRQYKPGRSDTLQRTCSRACGTELQRRNGTLGAGGRAQRKRWPSCRIYVQPCEHCGKLFTARRRSIRYCSLRCGYTAYNHARSGAPKCRCACGADIPAGRQKCDDCVAANAKLLRQRKKRAERARKRGATREPYTLAEIAARDRYRCGLCNKPVTMTQAVPHPKAPTIDHVVPLSISKDDTRANVQLAHFGCNVLKGTRGSQQLAMFG